MLIIKESEFEWKNNTTMILQVFKLPASTKKSFTTDPLNITFFLMISLYDN